MKKLIILSLSILLFSTSVPLSFSQTCDSEMSCVTHESSVNLLSFRKDSKIGSCSGVVVFKTKEGTGILTAKHCVQNRIKMYINGKYEVQRVIEAEVVDLAYVEIDEKILGTNPAPISVRNERWNQCVHVRGNYLTHFIYANGRITIISNKMTYADLQIKRGTSGAGVFNEQGLLVGILVNGAFNDPNGFSVRAGFINAKQVGYFLNNVKIIRTLRR